MGHFDPNCFYSHLYLLYPVWSAFSSKLWTVNWFDPIFGQTNPTYDPITLTQQLISKYSAVLSVYVKSKCYDLLLLTFSAQSNNN